MQSDTQCERTCFSDSSSEIEQNFSVDGLIVIPLKKKNVGKKTKRKSFREIKAGKISDKIQEKNKEKRTGTQTSKAFDSQAKKGRQRFKNSFKTTLD